MKLLLCYFSATGNTAKVAKVIGEEFRQLGVEVEAKDITPQSERAQKIDLEPYQAFVMGAPIFSGAPRGLSGSGCAPCKDAARNAPCSSPTEASRCRRPTPPLKRSSKNRASLSSRPPSSLAPTHSTWAVEGRAGRPDASDFEVAKEYAKTTHKRFTGEDSGILGEREKTLHTEEQLDSIETFRFNVLTQLPTRQGEA